MLIDTKIAVPSLRTHMVDRPRQLHTLQKAKDKRLILLVGPAGSGKTSLTCLWTHRYKLPVAWYSLDENDNEPDLFFRYLMTSLQNLETKLEPAFSPFLQGQKVFSNMDIVGTVTHHLGKLDKDVYVVLDDYHQIKTGVIHDAVSQLIQNAPPQLHIVLLSRMDPPFSLARFRSWNQIIEIRVSELNFDKEEAQVFIKKVLGIDLSDEQFETLYNLTEGWAAGLQLTGLSIQEKKGLFHIETVAFDSSRHIADYFIAEVFNVQSEMIRNFLLDTAILDRFNADLCHEMTGMANADEVLEQLERNNLFLVPLGDIHCWYRYHHLFAESLRRLINKTKPAALQPLHRKAALWFAGKNLLEEAFHHALASKDLEFFANLMEDHLMFLLVSYELKSFRRWLDRLPPRLVRQRYLLMIYEGFEALQQGYVRKSEMILAEVEGWKSESILSYSNKKRRVIEELLVLLRNAISITLDPVNHDIETLYQSLRKVSLENTIVRAELESWIVWVHTNKGNITKALELLQDSFKNFNTAGISFGIGHVRAMQARTERVQGNLHHAECILEKGLNWAKAEGLMLPAFRKMYHFDMGIICYFQNELGAALDHITTALQYLSAPDRMDFLSEGYRIKAFICQAMGDAMAAGHCMERSQFLAIRSQIPFYINYAECEAARLFLLQGAPGVAVEWEKKRAVQFDEPFSEQYENECLVLAHLRLVQEKYESVIKMLNHLRPRSCKRRRMESVLKIDILYSAAMFALSERKNALSVMERAIGFAEKEGYIRPFVDYAPFIGEMLIELRQSRETRVQTHTGILIKICGLENISNVKTDRVAVGALEYLTPREVDVLTMIANGYSNKEIADKMFISLNTVKTHNKHIFRKLNVKSRPQAMVRAKQMNIPGE
ncbi:MAG: hypothetical protein JRH15_11245 [Deltaproteobacteria bacterium]|nr:hypothetical protein [Deltaproteobacteria bacterium]